MPTLLLLAVSMIAAWCLALGTPDPTAMVSLAASVAALTALHEHRHRDAALATGIAVGAGTAGLAMLPVLVGTLIARRRVGGTALPLVGAAIATALLPGWTAPINASLATVLPRDLTILLSATACGVAAWLGAACASRPPSAREIDAAAVLACLALPMLAPVGVEPAGIAVALALAGVPLTLQPIARAANDNPLPLRPLPA